MKAAAKLFRLMGAITIVLAFYDLWLLYPLFGEMASEDQVHVLLNVLV